MRARLRQKLGQPLDVDQLEEDLKRIYGLGYYEMVSYSLSPTGQGSVLNIVVKEKSWGPNYLSFGLGYEDNFNDDTRFNVGAALRMTELNDWGVNGRPELAWVPNRGSVLNGSSPWITGSSVS